MIPSLAYIAGYALLIGFASFIEVPVGRGFGAFQLNALIRIGSLAAAVAALLAVDRLTLPPGASALAGLGIGLIVGVGSILYCFAVGALPVTVVVTLSNLYLAVTTLLGIVALGEALTGLKLAGLGATLAGALLLSRAPARFGVQSRSAGGQAPSPRALSIMGAYIVLVGVGAFLEKPILKSLDPTQLNALVALGMTAVAGVALAARGPRLPREWRTVRAIGVGVLIGLASVLYFLGLRGLPVSVAAAGSNAYMLVTVMLSVVIWRQPLSRERSLAIALTILGVTLLALSTA